MQSGSLLYTTKIFPRRQQFSKYHPQKQKLHLGKQSQHNTNWFGPAYLSQNPAHSSSSLPALAWSVYYDPVQATSWNFLIYKVSIIICFTKNYCIGVQRRVDKRHGDTLSTVPGKLIPSQKNSVPCLHCHNASSSHLHLLPGWAQWFSNFSLCFH